jgi:uncharacterized membrane protein
MIYWITTMSGRLHPMLVHLPIGILYLAFAFECISFHPRYRKLRQAIQPALFLGALSSILAAISGYFLSQEGGYDDALVGRHQAFGIATAVFSALLIFLRKIPFIRRRRTSSKYLIRIAMSGLLVILLTVTGHYGGSLTHGDEFLSFPIEESNAPPALTLSYKDEAIYYEDVIQPILMAKCYSCHSAKKQKGELRLDGVEYIEKGGKHGKVISGTIADSSSLYSRLMLPLDDEEHMPPNEKPQLSSAEISLIRVWLEDGARFNKPVNQFGQREKIKQYISMVQASNIGNPLIPGEETKPGDQSVIESLRRDHVIVLPISAENNHLNVSFVNAKNITASHVQSLLKLKEQIVQLSLSYSNISDEHLTALIALQKLRSLDLRHTKITDASAESIGRLKELRVLNLMNTRISDRGVRQLHELENLQKLFVYETDVTAAGVTMLKIDLPKVEVDTGGYKLLALPGDTVVFRRKR